MSDLRTAKLQLPYDRVPGDLTYADDNNRFALYLENTVANVLLSKLIGNGLIQRDEPTAEVDATTGRITRPEVGSAIAGVLDGKAILMGRELEQTGTVGAATTSSLMDINITAPDNHWVGAFIIFTSGDYDGQAVQVDSWSSSQATFTWDTPLPSAPSVADTYVVTFYYVQDYTSGATNYVYAEELVDTAKHGRVQWVASTTPSVSDTSILVAAVTLDGGGAITEVDNYPLGHGKALWGNLGAVNTIVEEEQIDWTAVGSTTTRLTISHDRFVARYSVEVELSDTDCSYLVLEAVHPERTIIEVNKDTGTDNLVDVSVTIAGRLDNTQ
jgi:hypothetical protein